jgi:hypothetical protein
MAAYMVEVATMLGNGRPCRGPPASRHTRLMVAKDPKGRMSSLPWGGHWANVRHLTRGMGSRSKTNRGKNSARVAREPMPLTYLGWVHLSGRFSKSPAQTGIINSAPLIPTGGQGPYNPKRAMRAASKRAFLGKSPQPLGVLRKFSRTVGPSLSRPTPEERARTLNTTAGRGPYTPDVHGGGGCISVGVLRKISPDAGRFFRKIGTTARPSRDRRTPEKHVGTQHLSSPGVARGRTPLSV